ncbi:MAG: hypothetical protein CTY18_06090 [Methylomonas sp.]|nr:MAG: hypothetical protein CTY18_06090 [Methylomonas sp.]
MSYWVLTDYPEKGILPVRQEKNDCEIASQLRQQAEDIRYLAGLADSIEEMEAEIAKAKELEHRAQALDLGGAR